MKTKSVSKQSNRVQIIQDYLKKPYARVLTPDPEGRGYTAEILEFAGCITEGKTPEEAYKNLEDAAAGWLDTVIESGQNIPEPSSNVGYSGNFALRMPRGLHRRASQMAEQDRISLNQFIVSAIAERVGAISLYSHLLEKYSEGLERTTHNIINIYIPTESMTVITPGNGNHSKLQLAPITPKLTSATSGGA